MQERRKRTTSQQLHREKGSFFLPPKGKLNSTSTLLLQAAAHKSIQAQGQEYPHSSVPCPQVHRATLLASVLQAAEVFSSFPLPKVMNADPHASLVTPFPPKHAASHNPQPGLLRPSGAISAQTAEEIVKLWEKAQRSPHHRGTQDKEGVIADRGGLVEGGWIAAQGFTRKDTTTERDKEESADGNTVHHRCILAPTFPIPTASCPASKVWGAHQGLA